MCVITAAGYIHYVACSFTSKKKGLKEREGKRERKRDRMFNSNRYASLVRSSRAHLVDQSYISARFENYK